MRWDREEYIELMTFGRIDRQMFVELFGPLVGLEKEWQEQGAADEEIEMVGFDWDCVPVVHCGGNTGQLGGYPPRLLEETEHYVIEKDSLGRTTKLFKGKVTIAHPLDFPVRTMDDWIQLKGFYEYSEDRIDWQQVERAKAAQKHGALVTASIPGGFDLPRQLLGEEEVCLAYYQQPELIRDILQTVGDTAFRVLERVSDVVVIDNLHVHEDMAGKSGPLIGPKQITEFVHPYYRRIWDLLRSRGTRIFSQDSDGNMNPVIDSFLECGVNVMYPMEPAAGMDVVKLREQYGKKLAFKGGIDKFVLAKGKEAIRAELEYKMQPLMQAGGMVFGLDHRIPNGTPLELYRYYVNLGREILGLPPISPERIGWQRMAF